MDTSTDCCTCWAQCIGGVLLLSAVVWGTFPHHGPGSGVVQMHFKIDTLCEQWWLKQDPGKKSGHMLHLLCHQGPLGSVCLQEDLDQMGLWPGYHLHHGTAKHGYSVVFSDESSFYLNVSDGRTHVRYRPGEHHLLQCIHPRHTDPT